MPGHKSPDQPAAKRSRDVGSNMKQGPTGVKSGDAHKVGDLRSIMGQGSRGNKPSPVGKLASIMKQ